MTRTLHRRFVLLAAVLYTAGAIGSAVMLVMGILPPALALAQTMVLSAIATTKWARLSVRP